jgi:hypothetical protein
VAVSGAPWNPGYLFYSVTRHGDHLAYLIFHIVFPDPHRIPFWAPNNKMAGEDGHPDPPAEPLTKPTTSLFRLVHELHQTITSSIDTSLSWEQLNAPALNYTLIRPIIDELLPEHANDTKYLRKESKTASGLLNVPGDGEATLGTDKPTETCLGAVLFALMANRSAARSTTQLKLMSECSSSHSLEAI